MRKEETIYAWHLGTGVLGYGDGRNVFKGMILEVDPGRIGLCDYGLHACKDIIGTLKWGSGTVLSLVTCGGRIIYGRDKFVCSNRTHLAVADITMTFHEIACWCAEQALALVDPDPRSVAAVAAKRAWIRGEIDDQELAAAADAARAAADARTACAAAYPAYSAAYTAAYTAAYSAADAVYAVYAAAYFAAYSARAAADAVYAAAYFARAAAADARAKQSAKLQEMVFALPEFAEFQDRYNSCRCEVNSL